MGKTVNLSKEDKAIIEKEMEKHAAKFVVQLKKLLISYQGRIEAVNIMYDGHAKAKKDQPWTTGILEAASGARFPKPALKTNSNKLVKKLEQSITGKEWAKIKVNIAACEKGINAYGSDMRDYYNKMQYTGTVAINRLEFIRDNGFIAVGVLCTTFVGGPAAAYLGMAKTAEGAMLAAGIGGFLSSEIKSVATGVGKVGSGEKFDPFKYAYEETSKAVTNGILSSWFSVFAKGINDKMLSKVITSKACTTILKRTFEAEVSALTSRTGVSFVKKIMVGYIKGSGKSKTQNAMKQLLPKADLSKGPNAMDEKVVEALLKDPDFLKVLKKEWAKNGKKK